MLVKCCCWYLFINLFGLFGLRRLCLLKLKFVDLFIKLLFGMVIVLGNCFNLFGFIFGFF